MAPTKHICDYHASLAIKQTMQVRREEYLDHMTFRANKRPLFTETFGPLAGLKEEWTAQGATPAELEMSAFRYRQPLNWRVPATTGWLGGCEEVILAETDEYIIARDRMGRRVKLCKGVASGPLPLDYPVRNMADWLGLKHHYAFSEERFGQEWERLTREQAEAGHVITVSIPGGFWEPRELMGDAEVCMAYYTQPELIHDILQTIGDTALCVLERVSAKVQVDQLWVSEDLAGKSGPLLGPKQFDEFIAPYYRPVWDLLRARGARLFVVDSDGNVDALLPSFLEAGVNVMFPMEPAAGMDIVKTRQIFGSRLALVGGIDKHVLRRSKEDIVAELEYKIPPMVRTGGCLLGLDHRIPNGTPLANYHFYIDKAWETLDREAAKLG